LHASVALKHPFAAAFFEACLLCIHLFLHFPGIMIEQSLKLLAMIPIVGRLSKLLSFLGKLFSCCCRVDNREPLPAAPSQVSLDLQEWNSLTSSAKSAFLSEHEANNSIVQVFLSMLQSACMGTVAFDCSVSCPAVCHHLTCCIHSDITPSVADSKSSDMTVSMRSYDSNESSDQIPHNARQTLRQLLKGTRAQLRSLQSPLQRDTHGFDSWLHLMASLNPYARSDTGTLSVSLVDGSDIVRQRFSLHGRMCRINKWQLLLRLHYMPWLRPLRRHALVHPPSQPHLSWSSSNMLLSNCKLQAAAAAVSFTSHGRQERGCQSDDGAVTFNRSLDAFFSTMEQHSRLLLYFKCESARTGTVQQERMVGCGWCCTCESCRGRESRSGGTMDFIKRMYK
jgi:hypothetical protein